MPIEVDAAKDRLSLWTNEEARRFLSSARMSPCGPYWSLRISTGLQASELLALRWEDLDWDSGAVCVLRMLSRGWGWRGLEVIPNDQRRKIHVRVPDAMMTQLRAHRRAQREFRLAAGPAWQEHSLVLTTATGAPMTPQALTREFRRIIEDAGVPRITTSALKHIDALAPISPEERHAAVKVVAELLLECDPARPPAT